MKLRNSGMTYLKKYYFMNWGFDVIWALYTGYPFIYLGNSLVTKILNRKIGTEFIRKEFLPNIF
jgi:hypothetical protein